jgi:Dolichyl-phosphate-mannose-protein mannosyltransferase
MIAGSLLLVLAVVALGAGAGFLAACVTVRSPVSFLLTTYLFAWTAIVGFTFALSPIHAVTRGTALLWSALVPFLALGIWLHRDRPVPRLRAALDAFGGALRDRAVLVAAAVPVIGVVYAIALAVGTPEDEGDALAYHVPRAAFWDQHHGVSYIAHAADVRLNVNPTFGEVGVLFTMLASGTQRFVGLVQIGAFVACGLSVAGLARRLGFGTRAAVFGAVVFAGLPVVVTQSWTAQNDLVVAAFLAAAAYFVLGDDSPDAVLGGLAIALAVGTKFTAIFLLPLLVLLIWLGRRGRPRARVASLAALGAVIGAFWYVVNLSETHRLTGGLSEGETTSHTLASFAGTLQRFSYDMLDLSGVGNSDWQHAGPGMVVYRIVGLASLAFAAVWLVRRDRLGNAWWLLLPGVVVAAVPTLISLAYDRVNTVARPHGVYLGGPLPNGLAASTVSWYGPVGVVGLLAGLGIAVRGSPAGRRRLSVILMAAAPIVGMACVAAAIVWDPTRGRFLIFPFALAAASWADFLATRWLAWTVALLTVVTAALSLVNAEAKPTGITALWPDSGPSVWGKPDWYAQTILRPDSDDTTMLRVVGRLIPSDTTLTLASRPNDFLAPYFGRNLTRRVMLVRDGQVVSPASNWLVAAPGVRPRSCRADWRVRYRLGVPEGWLIAQRVGTANCPPSRFS